MLFGVLNPEKIWHQKLGQLPTSPVCCSHCTFCCTCVCYDKSVRPSVCPCVRHTPTLCQNEGTQRNAVFTVG